ncbi:MAG: thiol:disulfide interchange protein DsbC [Oleiphilaceae bacterium]|jgi:thiol:disulfide interchange protein DsbC
MKFVLVFLSLSLSVICFADNKLLSDNLSQSIPGLVIKSVEKTKMDGLFQVETTSGEILFSSADGRYFVTGDMYSTENNELVNLSEAKRESQRAQKISIIPDDQKIIFPAKGEIKGKIAVFTDIDCGYCRKLHKEVPELNEMGIEVSYLAFPRAGLKSESYNKYVSAWCADDKLAALTDAKNGKALEAKVCANPISNQYHLGKEIGISGTPAIILQSGGLIPGYINAQRIGEALGLI